MGHHTEKITKKKFAWKATVKNCNKTTYGMKFMKIILLMGFGILPITVVLP